MPHGGLRFQPCKPPVDVKDHLFPQRNREPHEDLALILIGRHLLEVEVVMPAQRVDDPLVEAVLLKL